MDGTIDEDYTFRDEVGLESLEWSRCDASRALNINTAIAVKNIDKANFPAPQGLITNDSIDGQITHVFGIRWRRCD